MNSQLYNKSIPFPDEMRQHMATSMRSIGGSPQSGDGLKRNKELQEKKSISYQQLKRIKNYFDTYKGDFKDSEFILNGGFKMKSWVDMTLNQLRTNIKMSKQNRANAGETNQFISTHEKDDTNVRPSQTHKKTLERHANSLPSMPKINEEINRIKKLINGN
jgi:hypothetical protein